MTPKKSKLAEIKTKQNEASVQDFINTITDDQKKHDSEVILEFMTEASKEAPKMWGKSMIGFGVKRYKSPKTGREVDWFKIGFAPRKANISLHLGLDVKRFAKELAQLGKHKTGVGCLYVTKLSDVNLEVLQTMITKAAKKD